MYAAMGLAVLILGGLAVVALGLWKQGSTPVPVVVSPPVGGVALKPPAPAFERPSWILSDVPSSAYCHDMINRLMCVGVSSYRPTRDEAVAEANDAALEELVSTVGLKISDPFFRETIMPAYSAVRAKALSALQAADLDRASNTYAAAATAVRKARKRVSEILQASGGAAVPSQRSDWYWEEYAGEHGKGNETLVFVRYDVPLDAVRGLVEKYSTTTSVLGTSAMTAFPAVAWQYATFTGGALLTKVGKPLAGPGIAAMQVVLAVGEQHISDATGFAHWLGEAAQAPGDLTVTVKAGDAPGQVISVRR
jgi:hypothetical protein